MDTPMSRSVSVLALLAALFATAACRRGGERVVGVVPKGASHMFWQTVHAGAISASTMEREHGFQDETRRRFPGIDIVGLQFGMADRAKAMAVTENILAAHPDLAGIFADNESSSARCRR